MKEEINKTKLGLFEEIKALVQQKSKEANSYTDKVAARTEENLKTMASK